MPPTVIDAQIRARIAEFAEELSRMAKQAAVESVSDALGGAAGPAQRRGPGRPRKTQAARRKPGRRPGHPPTAKATARAGKRVRRSAGDLEALAGKVHAFVRSNAGSRMEEISAGLGVQTKDLGRPVASLLDTKKLRTEGQRRGTRYYAGGRKGAARKARTNDGKKRKTTKKTGRKGSKKRVTARKTKRAPNKRRTTKATAAVATGAAPPA